MIETKFTSTRPIGRLSWHLFVDCPCCKEAFNAATVDAENDYVITRLIFNNEWDQVPGCDLTCPNCEHEFQIGEIEY